MICHGAPARQGGRVCRSSRGSRAAPAAPLPRRARGAAAAGPGRPPGARGPLSSTAARAGAGFGVFVCSGSPGIAEALAVSGLDWICIDAQHGPVSYSTLHDLLAATSGAPAKRIVRVSGPRAAADMQQALE
jgi:hypothetical protein